MKLISWNVNGVRAVQRKGFAAWVAEARPDLLCLQETKAREDQLDADLRDLPGYTSFWCAGERPGYSGVAIYARTAPVKVERGFGLDPAFDREGRILIAEYPAFTLLNIYFPNGQKDDERLRYKLAFYDAFLNYCEARRREGRELVICGDFNTAHHEIDIARPKENEKVSGFLPVERAWMDAFEQHGYVDTFRRRHPDAVRYSWWSPRAGARARDIGWRIDYFFTTAGLEPKIVDAGMLTGVMGSDHCPVTLELEG